MSKRSNHVVPSNSGWAVRKSGALKVSRIFETKDQAIQFGKVLSKNEETELFIHKRNGMVQDRNSYGTDPNPPKDKS